MSDREIVPTQSKVRTTALRIHTEVSYEDLNRIESTEENLTDTPRTLPRSRIKIADNLFQWRLPEEDITRRTELITTPADAAAGRIFRCIRGCIQT
jgi:hypothetical protein